MNPATAWTNENQFGAPSNTTGRWEWNDQGLNCTVVELMNYAEVQYCNTWSQAGINLTPDMTTTTPSYFTLAYLGGIDASPFQYGGLVPLVAIYKIDWDAYYAATGTTGTGINFKKRKRLVFPKVPDQHKVGQPLIPNGLGVLYVLFTTVYLFLIYFLNNPTGALSIASAPLYLAACILFGGFMGLLDDWIDLKWRYKAFMPLIAALPLISFAQAITRKNINSNTVNWNNSIRISILLPNYSTNCHDSYKCRKHAWRIKRVRNNMPSHSYYWINGSFTIIHSNDWTFVFLANFSLLQLQRKNFCW